jgi:ribosomal protein S27AE
MKKILKQEKDVKIPSKNEKRLTASSERTKKVDEKVKEIRKIIKEESAKSQEYHDKNKEHKEWVKKSASSTIITVKKKTGRRKCPNCNEDRKEMIHESIDKTNVIMSSPRVYGKKYKCGRCGTEWREV